MAALAENIDDALPQTQCTRCGYPDCAAYARAVASAEAGINQCPPGGDEGVTRLAQITGRPVLPLNPAHGLAQPRFMAVIDEAWCIGCTLCIAACPTDAIFGTHKAMHTVIEAHCTGCELCLPVCPVDCISLENATGDRTGWAAWSEADAAKARGRYASHRSRRDQAADEAAKKRVVAVPISQAPISQAPGTLAPGTQAPGTPTAAAEQGVASAPEVLTAPTAPTALTAPLDAKRAVIEAALARARAKRTPPA